MKVVKIFTNQAVPGMKVAEDVLTKDHHLVIAKDTRLTDKIITRLEFYSIPDLFIETENDSYSADTSLSDSTYYDHIRQSESFQRFHLAYISTVNEFKYTLDSIATKDIEVDSHKLLDEVDKLLFQCETNFQLFDMLHCIREYDDTTYIHSLNVALICNIIGKWLHFSPEDLEAITLAGLLHDLGKLMIPFSIISKPAKLTEEEFSTVKTHAIRGYNLLKSKNLDPRIKHCALMHHERCDGSGYPNGFLSEQIEPFAKLVAIADVYDAMTCARVYRGPLCPFEVIHIFETEGLTKYDPKYIMIFLEAIVQTYIHNNVRLNNNQIGEIIMINKMELSRPVVRVGDDFIDLSKQRNLFIEALI